MLFLQNEAKKYLFMNGLQFASLAEAKILRDEGPLKGRPGTSPNLQLLAIENSGEVGAGEAEAMGLAQARAKATKAYGLSDGLELNK